jgi:hypothetical protein
MATQHITIYFVKPVKNRVNVPNRIAVRQVTALAAK